MIYFIINPAAGNGSAHHAIWEIEKYMKEKRLKYKFLITKYPKHASALAMKAVEDGASKIVAVGGDGTVFEIVTGIARSGNKEVKFGILPFGTGNDFVKTLKIKKNLKKGLDIITNDKFLESDLITVNDQYYSNIASVGIDTEIAQSSYELKEKYKGFAYFVAILKNIATYKSYKAVLKVDGKIIDDTYTLIAVANGKYYGGGFAIAPNATLDSGKIVVCAVKKIPNFLMALIFPTILFGKHASFPFIDIYECEEVELYVKDYKDLNIDGNIFETQQKLKFRIIKKALKILVP